MRIVIITIISIPFNKYIVLVTNHGFSHSSGSFYYFYQHPMCVCYF